MNKSGAINLGFSITCGVFMFAFFACEDVPTAPVLQSTVDDSTPVAEPETTATNESIESVTETTEEATIDSLMAELEQMRPLAEECCTQPGDASECWMNDAEQDGVLCDSGTDCPSNSCNITQGRCNCASDDDCNDGVCVDGLCGPSWCNGYLVCSCWGGCEWWSANSEQTLHDLAEAQGMYCCEGLYAADPIDIDPSLGGYFTQTPCGGCSIDADCDDNNPCTADSCIDETCAYANLTGTQDAIPDAADCPFNALIYATDCARASCNSGNCSVEINWHEGEACVDTPTVVPDGLSTDCYTRTCASDGTCGINISEGAACNVGENDCSDARCDADAHCIDAPLDAAGLAVNPECCDPAVTASFDDSHVCSDDFCCIPDSVNPRCEDVRPYTDRNVPNYDPASPGDCCMDSYNCDDNNGCTQNICCGIANAGLSICGGLAGDPSWECVQEVLDKPGCCDAAPESLADNCDDDFTCTVDVCCTPDEITAAADTDACFNAQPYNCADSMVMDSSIAGCCDPDLDPSLFCDDANSCTSPDCNLLSYQCEFDPNIDLGCCGPNTACRNDDENACTLETCCDPLTIGDAVDGDPCFGALAWTCGISVNAIPGCCTDVSECDDGNPCTEDSCDNNICTWSTLSDLSAVAGVCCTLGGTNDAQCADSNDANDCTQNICCGPDAILNAVAGDPCYEANVWSCKNPVVDDDPLPVGCCTPSTYASDCNPDNNPCVVADCDNNNCQWTPNDSFAFCCNEDIDCPTNSLTRPCLESSSCDLADNPVVNSGWAQCDLTFFGPETVCGTGNDCYDMVCDDPANEDWSCSQVSYVPAGTTICTPPLGPACGDYYCDGNGGCTDLQLEANFYANQTCDGSPLGSASTITQAGETNACTTDDYEPDVSGLFTECAGETYSDVVYNYGDVVADDYDLIHRVVSVTDVDGDWNPIIYAQSACGDNLTQTQCNDTCTFVGSNYNTTDYGGFIIGECAANESTIVTGPYPVTDVPNHNIAAPVTVDSQDFDQNGVRDGYDVSRTYTTSLVVDSRYTTPDNGGTFDLQIDNESHNNNDCINIGSYGAAPIIDGNFQWKQRWRGTTISGEYNNAFGAGSDPMGMDIASGTATDPHQAFFKLEIPDGSGEYLAYVDWNAMAKRGEAGNQGNLDSATTSATFFQATLSEVFENPVTPTECSTTDMNTSVHDDIYYEWPPQLSLDATDTDSPYDNAWLAVGNYAADDYGDYELTVLKMQPDFFGFTSGYSATGANNGCGTLDYFDAEGYRLDFIPSGGTKNGYLMTISYEGNGPDTCSGYSGDSDPAWGWGWPVHPRCYGTNGLGGAIEHNEWLNQDAHAEVKMLPFAFPLGSETYQYAYFDTSGRITLLQPVEGLGTCSNNNQCKTGLCNPAGTCVCSTAVSKCFYDYGGIDVEPDVEEFFMHTKDGGMGPVIAGAWGSFRPKWVYAADTTYGYMTAQSVVFEGTTAFVVSWVAMEVDPDANEASAMGWAYDNYAAHPSWQVILRADGRIVYYYRPNIAGAAFDRAVEQGTFVVGVSGGISTLDCQSSGQTGCVNEYGTTTECDNDGGGGLTPTYKCYRQIVPLVDGSNGLGNE